jgi:hypothetical protein
MSIDVIANTTSATVTTGGTTAPTAGTVEGWVVVEATAFPAIGTGDTQQYRVIDAEDISKTVPNNGSNGGYEEMLVTARASGTSWTVERGVGGTTPKAHSPGWTCLLSTTGPGLNNAFDTLGAAAEAQANAQAASLPLSGGTMSGAIAMGGHAVTGVSDLAVSGLTGAVAATRYVGRHDGGAPTTGTFAVGDWILDATTPAIWVCTAAGSPGTWGELGGAGSSGVTSVFTRTGAVVAGSGDYTVAQVTGAAPLASPALTGTPTAPTKTALTNNTDVATTAYADAAVAVETSRAETAEALKAPLASPALTGTPTAPTATGTDNSTKVATTAFVKSAVASGGPLTAMFNPYSYTATGGANDTTPVQNAINAAVASGVAATVYLPSIFNVTGVSVTNAVAPVTFTGPGGLKLNAGVAASTALLNVVNSPYTKVRDLTLDENGQNQTNANICVVAYDNASSDIKVYDNYFINAIGFVFFKGGGVPGVFTNNVEFCRNVVNCYTAGVYQDMVVMTMANGGHCDGNTVIGMSATFSAINIYESNQCPAVGNQVSLVAPSGSNAVFGISVQSSSGCPVTGSTVWGDGTGSGGFYAYATFKEGDNGGSARDQTDAQFAGNNSYQTAGSNGVAFYIANASNTLFDGGIHEGYAASVFMVTTGTNGAVVVTNVNCPSLPPTAFFYNSGATFSPAPVFRNNYPMNPATVTAPAFPATTVTYTNTTGVDVYAYVTNGLGAMTTLVNGNAGPSIGASLTDVLVFIPANGTFKPTYASGSPSWIFQGN